MKLFILLSALFVSACGGYTSEPICDGKLSRTSKSDIEVQCNDGRVLVIHANKYYLKVNTK